MKGNLKHLFTALLIVLATVGCCFYAANADSDYVDLTTFTPKSATVGWGALHVNEGLDGNSIDMTDASGGTTVFAHGFTAHASSSLTFDVSGVSSLKAFTAFIGAEHATTNGYTGSTSIAFSVYADDTLLYRSGTFTYSTPCEEIFVPLPEGTRVLKLETDDLGSNVGDHSAWGAPRLYVGELDLHAVKTVTLSADPAVLPADKPVLLQASYTDYTGAATTPESVVFSVDDPTIASVSSSGLVTPAGKSGQVKVSATATLLSGKATGSITLCFLAEEEDETYGPYYDLSYAIPAHAEVGWGNLCVNTGLDAGSIDMASENGGTVVYPHGFTAHASSALDFDLSALPQARVFSAFIGVEHAGNNALAVLASVRFSVYADSALLYESDVLGYNDSAQEIFVVIPEGTQILSLRTDSVDGNSGDHSAWGAPRLLTDEEAAQIFRKMQVAVDKEVYLTGSSFAISVTCTTLSGAVFTPETLTFVSSAPSVVSVSQDGQASALSRGEAVITVTARQGDIEKTESLLLTVMDEIPQKNFTVASPDGTLRFALSTDEQGRICFAVDHGAVQIVEPSFIGIDTDACRFSNAFVFRSAGSAQTTDESYTALSGKRSIVRNHYTEQTFTFAKNGYLFHLTVRVYDDGFAYRYTLEREDGSAQVLTVGGETGTFRIPEGSKLYAEFLSSVTSTFCYETGYREATTSTVPSPYICMPLTVDLYAQGAQTGEYLLLSEADYFTAVFPGSLFLYDREKNDGTMRLSRAPVAAPDDVVTVTTGFTSPWRYGVCGTLKTLFESDMAEKLSPAPQGDFSWVEPGVTAWMWLSEGYRGQRTESTIREYIDLAHEMGWKYLILDEGWQPNSKVAGKVYDGYFDYFEDLIAYAESKGVGFIAWVKYCDLDTPQEREILSEWASMGIKGIKADFFDNENAATLEGYKAIYEKCAENHLIVNCHGASKPTGERRTWPNVINREAVNGEEGGGLWLDNAMYWAYARNIVGPIDITPRLYSTSGNTTVAQMACNVVFESGMPCMASDSLDYLNFSANSFYKDLPAAWDETTFLGGEIGSYVCVARRSGKNWYYADMSLRARSGSLDLSFLGSGTYTAVIYEESGDREVRVTTKTVTASDTLSYTVRAKGGYTVRFERSAPNFDLTGNGTVNIADVTVLLNVLQRGGEALSDPKYDLNEDGGATIADVTALLNRIAGK